VKIYHKIIKESPIVAQECDTGIQGVGEDRLGEVISVILMTTRSDPGRLPRAVF